VVRHCDRVHFGCIDLDTWSSVQTSQIKTRPARAGPGLEGRRDCESSPRPPTTNNLKLGGYVIIPVGGPEQKRQRRSSRYDWVDVTEMSNLDEKEHV